MTMKSFRARLIVWTLLLVGGVLAVFGFASDLAFYRIKLSSVDERLALLAPPQFPSPEHSRFWIRYEELVTDASRRLFGYPVVVVAYAGDPTARVVLGEIAEGERDALIRALPAPEGLMAEPRSDDAAMPPLPPPPERFGPGAGSGLGRATGPRWRRGLADREAIWGPESERLEPLRLTIDAGEGRYRFAVYQFAGYNAAIGVDLGSVMADVSRFRSAYFWGFPAALALLALGSWAIASRAIKPIRKLTHAASRVSAARLSDRIPTEGEDREFARLIDVYNRMLERLERSFAQANRFSADAAHELKTPLAILQGNLENALQAAPDNSESQRMCGALLEEILRLKAITRKLLLLAQADTGRLPLRLEQVDFGTLLRDAIDSFESLAPPGGIAVAAPASLPLPGDASLIEQILQNLISNAIKYTADPGMPIEIAVCVDGGMLLLDIENACGPIAPEQRERLFDRFFRLDNARNRQTDGTGLGLSLAREFARALGGDLSLAEASDANRIRFRLSLPLDAAPNAALATPLLADR